MYTDIDFVNVYWS